LVALAVSAVIAGNYQPAMPRFLQESRAVNGSADDGTAKVLAVPSLFPAVFVKRLNIATVSLPPEPAHTHC
jgi:hypothetical protein